jgi:hypothetical protein
VLGALGQPVGDLELVRGEVALGVAEVAAVEPHVALVEEAVEHQPGPLARGAGTGLEPASVQQRPVGVGERLGRPPVAGDLHGRPRRVVEAGVGPHPSQLVVGHRGSPGSGKPQVR